MKLVFSIRRRSSAISQSAWLLTAQARHDWSLRLSARDGPIHESQWEEVGSAQSSRECLQVRGMNFDQVRIIKQSEDIRPESQKEGLELGPAHVTQAHPDDFGWWTLQHDPIKEIRVAGENRPVMLAGMFPKLAVGLLLPEIRGVRTLAGQQRHQRSGQVFVNQQVFHEATRMVDLAALTRRAKSRHDRISSRSSCGWATRTSSTESPALRYARTVSTVIRVP